MPWAFRAHVARVLGASSARHGLSLSVKQKPSQGHVTLVVTLSTPYVVGERATITGYYVVEGDALMCGSAKSALEVFRHTPGNARE